MEAGGKVNIIYPSRTSRIKIYNIADIHYGNRSCNMKRFREDVKKIKEDPDALWFGGGDYCDFIAPGDKRWDASIIDEDIKVKDLGRLGHVLCKKMIKEFEPIQSKCLGLLYGNHEDKYMKSKDQQDLHTWMCTEMGVPDLGYCCFMDLCFSHRNAGGPKRVAVYRQGLAGMKSSSHWTLRFFLHHGFSSAASPGGKLNSLIKAMTHFDADCYMMGHVHDQKAQRNVRIGANSTCTELEDKQTIGVITGSYLMTYAKGFSGYGEQKGYGPTPLGAVKITVEPDKHRFVGEV